MKALGIIILVLGLALGGYALTMDVSVDVPAQDFGYGIKTPRMQVANVDRMAQRQNMLIFSGILAVVGAILTGFASMRPANLTQRSERTESLPLSKANSEPPASPVSVSICPKCRSMASDQSATCGRCGFSLSAD